MRFLVLGAFLTLLVADTCSMSDCGGCGLPPHATAPQGVGVGQQIAASVACSSCRHPHISATWLNLLSNIGSVQINVRASCAQAGDLPFEPVQNVNVEPGAASQTYNFPINDGKKDKCGDPSTITWSVYFRNNTQETLDGVKLNVACATPGSSASATAPSSIERR